MINKNCFDAVICKNGWKNSNNKYHHKNNNPEYHYYSPALVDEFVKKAMANEDYLMNTKNGIMPEEVSKSNEQGKHEQHILFIRVLFIVTYR